MSEFTPLTDADYSLMVLRRFRSYVRRTPCYRVWVSPRNDEEKDANEAEVIAALDYAIALVLEKVKAERQA